MSNIYSYVRRSFKNYRCVIVLCSYPLAFGEKAESVASERYKPYQVTYTKSCIPGDGFNATASIAYQSNLHLVRDFVHRCNLYFKQTSMIVSRLLFITFTLSPAFVYYAVSTCCKNNSDLQEYCWRSILHRIESCGPCINKFAQWVSTRPDLFPSHLCNRLHSLQYQTTRHDVSTTIKQIKQKGWAVDVGEKDHKVLGSGCVAQVIKGKVIEDGKSIPVAVKVIDPSVRGLIIADLNVLRAICAVIDAIPGVQIFSVRESVEEFAMLMTEQLDLRNEARSLDRFRLNFDPKQSISILELLGFQKKQVVECTFPKPMYPYVSSDILVESYAEGELMTDLLQTKDPQLKKKLAKIGLRAILKMIFIDNFIHADLHPGNIIVLNVDGDYQLCLIDAGIVVELNDRDRKNFTDLFYAIVLNNGYDAGNLMIERSHCQTVIDREGFAKEMQSIVSQIHQSGLKLNSSGVGTLLQKLLISCYNHQVKLESKFSSVLIAIGVMEGLGRQLDENLDILQMAIPYIVKASAQRKLKSVMPTNDDLNYELKG